MGDDAASSAAGCVVLVRMSELDERGILLDCPKCGRRNRMRYEGLSKAFRCGQCQCELESIGEPVDIHNDLAFEALISHSAVPVLVDFWAPWCGPCKIVAPEVRKLAKETAGRLLVAKVNTEEAPTLGYRFRISAIPTMVLFQNGIEVARQAGAMPAPQIRKFIEQAQVNQQ
ncbi:MAG TPA: thioredoxin [Candidatus Udaeobacter sp.]|nr:thioredoxin [Candidatus Udaeobacter sp.]